MKIMLNGYFWSHKKAGENEGAWSCDELPRISIVSYKEGNSFNLYIDGTIFLGCFSALSGATAEAVNINNNLSGQFAE